MSIPKMQTLGAVLGFIPLVSSVAGIVKFIHYKKAEKNSDYKTNGVAQGLLNLNEKKFYNKLWKASLVEIIPGVNIIAALFETIILLKHSCKGKLLLAAKEKKGLLLHAMTLIGLNKEEMNDWVEKAVDLNILLDRKKIAKSDVENTLLEFGNILSGRIATSAIPKQKKTLNRLMALNGLSEHPLNRRQCLETDPLNDQLELLRELKIAIEEAICQLHLKHDPARIIENKIKNLDNELGNAMVEAFRDHSKAKSIATRRNEVFSHYMPVMSRLQEIRYLFSYKNVTEDEEELSLDVISGLNEKIEECLKLLQQLRLSWATKTPIALDRQRALHILGLEMEVNEQAIRKAYFRLCLIHHPDKGGDAQAFNVIREAYEFLQNSG